MEINNFKQMVGGEEENTIAIDFDGVIHKNSKGFHDGTIYDEPIEDVKKGLEYLSKSYKLVIYSCKANPNRPKIDNKTGVELIWDWLEKHNLKNYIDDISYEKPNAKYYIDDKAIMFLNWKMVMGVISA
tara:strand:- start:1672 stop:2058 length:387 start_codon:yes stop_codon:yes gene_type:complete